MNTFHAMPWHCEVFGIAVERTPSSATGPPGPALPSHEKRRPTRASAAVQGDRPTSSVLKFVAILAITAVAAGAADKLTVFGHEWTVPVATDWKLDRADGVEVLRLVEHRGPLPGPRRPIQFALRDVENYGRLTVEADVKPLGGSLLIVFAYRDEAHFDYAHLSVDPGTKQPVHNGIFHVYGGERVRISSERGPAAFSSSGRWYHVRLTDDAATGAVGVTVDGEAVPALQAVDRSLGAGKCGFGSFDETGEFKNVKITENR